MHPTNPRILALGTNTDIAQFVRELRQRAGLTQEKFAAELGVTFPTINRWENGHTRPSPLAMRQIEALALKVAPAARADCEGGRAS